LNKLAALTGIAPLLVLLMAALAGCPAEDSPVRPDPPSLPPVEEPAGYLVGSIWQWTAWELEFKTNTQVVLGPDTLSYTYDETARTGTLEGVGDFTLSEDETSIIFTNYKGYGTSVVFRTQLVLDSALVGTVWGWGHARLGFTTTRQVLVGAVAQSYHYNTATQTGTVKTLGDFTLSEGVLTFTDYKGYGFPASFREQREDTAPTLEDTLVGTEWTWGSEWGASWIVFISETHSRNGTYLDWYVYDPLSRQGEIEYMGKFTISRDGTTLFIPQYGTYPHSATFTRVE
jgi:hypothetical protein